MKFFLFFILVSVCHPGLSFAASWKPGNGGVLDLKHEGEYINNTSEAGLHIGAGVTATLNLNGFNLNLSNNMYTTYFEANSHLVINGVSGSGNKVYRKNDTETSYSVAFLGANASLTFKNTDVYITGSSRSGNNYGLLSNQTNSLIRMEGDGQNVYQFKSNTGNIVTAIRVATNDAARIEFDKMNIEFLGNISESSFVGIYGVRGLIDIVGSNDNYILMQGNKSNQNNVSGDFGIIAYGGRVDIDGPKIEFLKNYANVYLSAVSSFGANAILNISNSDIFILNNVSNGSFDGISFVSGGTATITGNSSGGNKLALKNNTATGLSSAITGEASTTAGIYNMDIEISENTGSSVFGIQSYGNLKIEGNASRKSTVSIKGTNEGGIYIVSGSFLMKHTNVSVDNDTVLKISSGAFSLEDSFLSGKTDSHYLIDAEGTGVIDTASLNLKNSIVSINSDKFLNAKDITINVSADNSYLRGYAAKNTSSVSNLILTNKSVWEMRASSELSKLSSNNSTIDMRGNTFNTLTVNEFSGTGNTIRMNTSAAENLSDRLVVKNALTGGGSLDIVMIGGTGNTDSNGIKIIDASSVSTNSGSFSLLGGKVDTSAYEYFLIQGDMDGVDSNSWYLRPNNRMTEVAKVISNEPVVMASVTKAGMNSLMKRLGDLRSNNPEAKSGAWVRTYAKHLKMDDFLDADMTLFGLEGGYDFKIKNESPDTFFVGAMAGYMRTMNLKNQNNAGKGEGNYPSVGFYGTWLSETGWFADATVRIFWEDLNMTARSSSGRTVKYDPARRITSIGFETGKQFKVLDGGLLVEPKVEAIYFRADKKSLTTDLGNHIKYGLSESFSTKFALTASIEEKTGSDFGFNPYIQIAVLNEWAGRTRIKYDNAEFKSDLSGISIEFGGGLNIQLNKKMSFYSDILYEKGEVVESFSTNLGIRYSW